MSAYSYLRLLVLKTLICAEDLHPRLCWPWPSENNMHLGGGVGWKGWKEQGTLTSNDFLSSHKTQWQEPPTEEITQYYPTGTLACFLASLENSKEHLALLLLSQFWLQIWINTRSSSYKSLKKLIFKWIHHSISSQEHLLYPSVNTVAKRQNVPNSFDTDKHQHPGPC